VISILSSLLRTTDKGLEWGSGRSTLWLARRVAHLTSVEHNPVWYERIKKKIKDRRMNNVTYLFREDPESYIDVIESFPKSSLDFVLVDGGPRNICANRALEKIRLGGLLILDDAHKHLPCDSHTPKARTNEMGPSCAPGWEQIEGLKWSDFLMQIKNWRCIWTSDGVTDTAIWVRPAIDKQDMFF
jgi:predicted O-methyltransferase YrrM